LTPCAASGHLLPVSAAASHDPEAHDPTKRHRHDIGEPDHGPRSSESTTKSIQVLLGLCIAGTLALVVYAFAAT
jgi:hypothetical protein